MTAVMARRVDRPVRIVLAAATAVGLWFGLTAPSVSPVLSPGVAQVSVVDVGDVFVAPDAGADGDGPRGRR